MKTLDRYIVRQFLVNFAILFVVLMSLFVVVDLIVDLDEFIQAGEAHAAAWLGGRWVATLGITVGYYGPVVLLVYVFFNGLIVVGAMGFTLTNLQRTRELTAMIASGVSLYRVAAPLMVTGLLLSALTLPVQEFVLPQLASQLVRKKSHLKKVDDERERKPVFYAAAGGGDLLSAESFDAEEGVLRGLQIHDRSPEGRTVRFVRADAAYWRAEMITPEDVAAAGGGSPEIRMRWVLENGVSEEINQTGAQLGVPGGAGEGLSARGVVREVAAYDTDLSPTVLQARQTAMFANLLSIRELQKLSKNRAVESTRRGKIEQVIWSRFSLMVLNALLLVMALPFFLSRVPGNTLVASLRAAGLCIGAWGGGLVMLQVGPGSLPIGGLANPALVAWLPVAMYLPVAAWQLTRIKT